MKTAQKNSIFNLHSFYKAFKNEWKAITRDRGVISVFISMGVLVVVIYSYIYGEEVVYDVPIAVIDQDYSKSSRDFINMIDVNPRAKTINSYTNFNTAKKDLYQKKVRGIVIVPSDFGKKIRKNQQPTVSVYSDASNLVLHRAVLGSVAIAQGYYNGGIKIKRAIASGNSISSVSPINNISRSLFNPAGGYGIYLIPSITALVLQLLILLAIGILGGTSNTKWIKMYHHQILTNAGSTSILFGRASLYLAIFFIIFPIQYIIIFNFFSFPMRASMGLIYLFNIPYVVSLVFLGILISTFFKRSEDAILFLSILSIPAFMLSGLSFPYEGFSPFFKYLGELLPSTSGTRGIIKLTQMGASFHEVRFEWLKLWGLSLLYFSLSFLVLRIKAKAQLKLK